MKHRRPTQHIRRYRSGRATLVNRGIRYREKLTVADSKNEFNTVEWNYLIKRFNAVPKDIPLDKAREEIKDYREKHILMDKLFRELMDTENDYRDGLYELEYVKKRLNGKKDSLRRAYNAYNKVRLDLGYSRYTSVSPEIQQIYDEL